ncbi:MAG: hypothetical protein CEN90_141 [Parcubacteria group bacterium Licking1014_17]|nr:MAG: hypothetical protein CEN90_141 [Parcubacteria group bacterium Licking1014_17]
MEWLLSVLPGFGWVLLFGIFPFFLANVFIADTVSRRNDELSNRIILFGMTNKDDELTTATLVIQFLAGMCGTILIVLVSLANLVGDSTIFPGYPNYVGFLMIGLGLAAYGALWGLIGVGSFIKSLLSKSWKLLTQRLTIRTLKRMKKAEMKKGKPQEIIKTCRGLIQKAEEFCPAGLVDQFQELTSKLMEALKQNIEIKEILESGTTGLVGDHGELLQKADAIFKDVSLADSELGRKIMELLKKKGDRGGRAAEAKLKIKAIVLICEALPQIIADSNGVLNGLEETIIPALTANAPPGKKREKEKA